MPNTSTVRPPVEVLFGWKYQTRMPEKQEPAHDPQLQEHNEEAKQKH